MISCLLLTLETQARQWVRHSNVAENVDCRSSTNACQGWQHAGSKVKQEMDAAGVGVERPEREWLGTATCTTNAESQAHGCGLWRATQAGRQHPKAWIKGVAAKVRVSR